MFKLIGMRPFLVGILCGWCVVTPALARDSVTFHEPFKYRTETHTRISQERSVLVNEIWKPLWQRFDSLVYGSVRAMTDTPGNFEGNLGLGYRRFMGDHVVGGYGYIDRRMTVLGSTFWQTTIGGEYITSNYEARANIYIPVNTTETYSDGNYSNPYMAGTGIYVRGPGQIIEEAQPGIDAEVGFKLPDFTNFIETTRVFGGAYHFQGDETASVTGVRARIAADISPRVRVGARAQYDAERGGQYFLEFTWRWPGRATERQHGLWARMADTPERDLDIVTGGTLKSGPEMAVMDTTTGQAARIIYVDKAAAPGGNGTAENPYNTLDLAFAGITDHDTVYIAKGDGTATGYDTGYTIANDDVTVIGAGSDFFLSGDRYTVGGLSWEGDLLVRPADDYPLITNAAGDAMSIFGDNVTLNGVQLDGASGSGLLIGAGADNVMLDNVRITGNGLYGINIDQSGNDPMTITMRHSTITGNLLYGIAADDTGAGTLTLDLGVSDDYGYNDIFGNLTADIYANTNGTGISAQGNFWGGGASGVFAGVNAGMIDTTIAATDPFCSGCMITFDGSYESVSNATGATPTDIAPVTMTGFRGHRYINVYGQGSPEFVINGAGTGSTHAKISSDDTVGVRATSGANNWDTVFLNINGSGINEDVYIQTNP